MLNYDLSHSFNIIKVTNADFRMFKEFDLSKESLKINNFILKADKGSNVLFLIK